MVTEEITAGIDWITATMHAGDDRTWLLWSTGHTWIKRLENEGYERKERSMLGYKGVSCGNCFIGERDDGLMLQMTGHHADRAIVDIVRCSPRYSRVDIQVTVRYDVMPDDVAIRAYREGVARARKDPPHRRRKLHIIRGSDGGDTCYIGSASADERSRIYNKEVQSEDPKYTRCWRYEITFKNDAACAIMDVLIERLTDYRLKCLSIVHSWHIKRGITLDWSKGVEMEILPPKTIIPTDIQRKLEWLERQVRPTVEYLRSAGYGDTIARLLGFCSRPGSAHSRSRRRGISPLSGAHRKWGKR